MKKLHLSIGLIHVFIFSCSGMETSPKKDLEITVLEDYCTNYQKPIPLVFHKKLLEKYDYHYKITVKPNYKESLRYPLQFSDDVVKGGKIIYALCQNTHQPLLKTLSQSPHDYLVGMCNVIRSLYVNEILPKKTFDNEHLHEGWSLVLTDQHQVWKTFFLDNFYKLINGHKDYKKYILGLDTKHLKNLPGEYPQTTISTSVLSTDVQPALILDHDVLLFIPFHYEALTSQDPKALKNEPTNMLFIRSNNLERSGWKGRTFLTDWTGSLGETIIDLSNSVQSALSHITTSQKPSLNQNKEYFPDNLQQELTNLKISFGNRLPCIALAQELLEKEAADRETNDTRKSDIAKVLSMIHRTYSHTSKRQGDEFIIDETSALCWSLFYHLLESHDDLENNKKVFKHTEHSRAYFPFIHSIKKLQRHIFMYNNASLDSSRKQEIKTTIEQNLKEIRNIITTFISFKDDIATSCNKDYAIIEYMTRLNYILSLATKLQRDDYLFEKPLFEVDHQERIINELLALQKNLTEKSQRKNSAPVKPTLSPVAQTGHGEEPK